MGSDTPEASLPIINGSNQKGSNYDEIFMQHTLHFADSLKDLKNLRQQLYSAAEYFESSYDKDLDHKQFVMESSKDYVAKALVSTVDHLGSVADKLNKFLDEKANEFSTTKIRFSCVEQRLNTFQGFVDLRGMLEQSLTVEAPKYHKRYNIPDLETFQFGQSKSIYKNYTPCPELDMHQPKLDNSFAKGLRPGRIRSQQPLLRKGNSRVPSNETSPIPHNFSFTRIVSTKEPGKRSVSPLRFPLKRSGTVANRSVSPSPFDNKPRIQYPPEPRRAISALRRPETSNKDREMESYTKRSKNLFRALLNVHGSRKDIVNNR